MLNNDNVEDISYLLPNHGNDRAEAAALLRYAANLIESDPEMDGSASWRAVDAMVILKSLNKDFHLAGIDSRTGRGGIVDTGQ